MNRRAALGIWTSGLVGLTSACNDRGFSEINGPDGKILQLEKDDLLVLVSDFAQQYHPGDRLSLKVLVNNQSSRYATARIRTRLLGKGQQAVVEAEAIRMAAVSAAMAPAAQRRSDLSRVFHIQSATAAPSCPETPFGLRA